MEKKICYMGVDPGKSGAMALYFPNAAVKDGSHFEFYDWPKEDNPQFIIAKIEDWLFKGNNGICYDIQLAVLEKVSAMPKQGVKSTFSFGVNFGMWQAILTVFRIPFQMMTPQRWQKGLITPSDGATPKARSQNYIIRRWPHEVESFKGARGAWKDGRSDAAIMAYQAFLEKRNQLIKEVENE